jgi:YVTN family beta-propeller protein
VATSTESFTVIVSTVPILTTIESPFLEPGDVRLLPDRSRAYVTNGARNTVSVVDTATHAVTTTIPAAGGPFRSAVSPDGARLYVVTGNGALKVLNLVRNTALATVDVGEPLTVGVSRDGQTVLVPRLNSTVALVDTASNAIVASLSVGPTPGQVVVSPVGNRAHVINFGDSSVSVIDTAARSLITTIPMPLGGSTGVFSPDGARYYQGDTQDVSAVDTANCTNGGSRGRPGRVCTQAEAVLVDVASYLAGAHGEDSDQLRGRARGGFSCSLGAVDGRRD